MLEAGLVKEVKRLRAQGCHKGMVSMQGLGYKEILSWLEGEISYEEAVIPAETGYPAFCKTSADMVSQGTGCYLAEQTGL